MPTLRTGFDLGQRRRYIANLLLSSCLSDIERSVEQLRKRGGCVLEETTSLHHQHYRFPGAPLRVSSGNTILSSFYQQHFRHVFLPPPFILTLILQPY